MDELDDIALLRKKALESRSRKVLSKDYDYEEQLQLHPHEELEMSYNAAKKRAARKKAAKRKAIKETSKKMEEEEKPKPKAKKEDDPMIHFVNPHGGFMPYSTLSLAVKRTQDIGHVSPISSESPSPVNLYAKEEPPAMAAVPPAVKTTVRPPETKQAAPPMKETAASKPAVVKSEKPVAANQVKETVSKAESTPKKEPVVKKPLSRPQRKDSHSRSSSSDSSSSFSSSSASSFSSNSSVSRHRKRRRRSSSSSSSSHSSSSVSSSSSSSSSSGSRRSSGNSRKRDRRSKRHDSEQRRSNRRRSVERNDSHHSRNRISRPDDGAYRWQNSRENRFDSQRGRGFYRPGGFQRNRTFSDGGGGRFHRNEPQEYQRDMRYQRPFSRPFGRGRQGFMRDRQNFNSPQFRNFRGRGRDFRNQQQRPFGLRHRLDSQPNFRSNERFVRRRDDDSRSPEHRSRYNRRGSVERHQSSRSDRRSPHTRYDSKIGAPIKESRDHVERRPRAYSESNQSKYSDRSPERHSRSPLKSTDRVQSEEEEESEAELELQPESDLELAPPSKVVNSHVRHPDSDHSGSDYSKERSRAQGKKRRSSSSSSSSSSGSSSSSDSSSEATPERNRRINSPIRVSPERREYQGKQGAPIHRQDHEDNSYRHPRSQGQKRLHSDPDSSLDAVSKRLRPDLALRLGPDPELSTRGSQHDEFVPSRQRRFYNNSGNVQPAKGNALEIARNFRMQKQKTTSKVSTVSKAIVKSTVVDNPTVMPDDVVKESDPEREKELTDRIRKIKEQNEKILQRQKEIEEDIEQFA